VLEPCDCVTLHHCVLGHSTTGHTEDLHSVATDLPLVPHLFHVRPDPPPAFSMMTTTSTLFVPGHTVFHPGQQTFSAFPSASYPLYVQSEHPVTSTPIHSTIPTSTLLSNHAAAYPVTHAKQHQPLTMIMLPPLVTFPMASTSTMFMQSQTVGQYSMPLLLIPYNPPTSLMNSHFLDCCESVFL